MADANVAGGGDPNILAITPEGSKLYAASYTAGTVTDIATSTDTVTKTITLAGTSPNPNALALTPNGCQLYVHDHANNQVDAITVSSDEVAASPVVGATGDPTGMSVTPDSTHVYVANHNGNSVSVIATATNTVSATLAEGTVGKEPYAVLATPSAVLLQAAGGARRLAERARRGGPLRTRLGSGRLAVMRPRVTAYTDTQPLSIPAAPARGTRDGEETSRLSLARAEPCVTEPHMTEPRRLARRRGRVTRVLSSIMLGGVSVLIAITVGGMMLGLWRFAVIDTGSMRPTLDPGDVAILTSEPTADLRKGQIIAFHPPGEPHLTVTHRAVSVKHTKHGVIFQTKGDANNARDAWRAHITATPSGMRTSSCQNSDTWRCGASNASPASACSAVIVILIVSMQLGWIWRPTPR